MPEENTSEEESQNDSSGAEGENDNSDTKTETNSDQDDAKGNESDKSKADQEEEFKDDGVEPVVRKKTNADWVAERRGKQIEKLKNQQGQKESEEEEDSEEDDDIDPEDEKVVEKVINKKLGPVINPILAERAKAEDDIAINEILSEYPELKPFEAKARRFMSHPSRKHLPVETIFAEVAGVKTLLRLGARKGLDAEDKAREGRAGGGTGDGGHSQTGAKKIWDMTNEEFEEYKRTHTS